MVVQPRRGASEAEAEAVRARAVKGLEADGHTVVNREMESHWLPDWFTDREMAVRGVRHDGLWQLSRVLDMMATVDAVYFVVGWDADRGCILAETCAMSFGVECMYDPS